jgi:hypothetical protein
MTLRRSLLPCLVAAALLGSPAGAAEERVPVRAQVVYATKEPGGMDSRLGPVAGDLRQLPYSTYRLLDVQTGSVALNQVWQAPLPGGRVLEVTPTGTQGGQTSLRVRVPKSGVNTTVRLSRGARYLLGGLNHEQGSLIIVLSVE